MPRGGARVGGGERPAVSLAYSGPGPAVPRPDDLTPGEAAEWDDWAPLAVEAGTLVPHTVPAFRAMCQTGAMVRRLAGQIAADGDTFWKITIDGAGQEQREIKAHPLIARLQVAVQRLEQMMARFCLAPVGRPLATGTQRQPSKWAKFGIGG